MPGVSTEQVRLAKEVDLLSYLQANEPGELLPPKNGEYRTVSHGSLVISNGMWIWNKGGIAGKTALDYLIKITKSWKRKRKNNQFWLRLGLHARNNRRLT